MKGFQIFAVIIIVGLVSCQKDEFPEVHTSGDPAFNSAFTFNGQSYSLSPGEMNLIQSANFTIPDTNVSFTSSLFDQDCNTCGPGFNIKIQSPANYSYVSTDDLYAYLATWQYGFTTVESVNILEITTANYDFINPGWWFLNGAPLNAQMLDSVSFSVSTPGLYEVGFTDPNPSCLSSALSTSHSLVYDGENIPCYANIMVDIEPFSFYAIPGPGFNPDSTMYEWIVGDTTFNTGNSYQLTTPEIVNTNEICVIITDSQGCQAEACMKVVTAPSGFIECGASVNIQSVVLNPTIIEDLSARFILEFTDEEGNIFTSQDYVQNDATLVLIDISPYTEPTMPNLKFAKATFEINCQLFNEEGLGFPFSGIIQTAIAYP